MAYDMDKCLTYGEFMSSIMDLGILRADTIEDATSESTIDVHNLIELKYTGVNLTAKFTRTVTLKDGGKFAARELTNSFTYDYTANRPYFNDGTYIANTTQYFKFISSSGGVAEQSVSDTQLKFIHSTTDTGYRLVASGGSIIAAISFTGDVSSQAVGETFISSLGFAYFEHVIDL